MLSQQVDEQRGQPQPGGRAEGEAMRWPQGYETPGPWLRWGAVRNGPRGRKEIQVSRGAAGQLRGTGQYECVCGSTPEQGIQVGTGGHDRSLHEGPAWSWGIWQ